MTLTQEILDAIRTQPENVEWRKLYTDEWFPFKGVYLSLKTAINEIEWRIKPKPYEEKHEVYFKSAKDAELFWIGSHISDRILFNWYDIKMKKDEQYTKKFEIIVRECTDE